MHKRVQQQKIASHIAELREKEKQHRKSSGTFGSLLKNQEVASQPAAPGSLPKLPHHAKAHQKTITLDQAQRLAKLAPLIRESAQKYNVPVELICGVILQESGGNAKAKSHAGAQGLMQLMPQTAKRFGVTNSYDPKQNIDGGTKYLRFLLDRFQGNVELSLAGYNAGEKRVEQHGMKIPPIAETQNYVPSVLGYTFAMVNMLHPPQQPPLPPNAKLA